jgi:peptidyl-prolyl cis-trans isomerase C
MKAEEVSEPLLTAFGFHVIKVLEEPQDVVKPLESVKGDIRYQMRNKTKKAELDRLLESVDYKKEN